MQENLMGIVIGKRKTEVEISDLAYKKSLFFP